MPRTKDRRRGDRMSAAKLTTLLLAVAAGESEGSNCQQQRLVPASHPIDLPPQRAKSAQPSVWTPCDSTEASGFRRA